VTQLAAKDLKGLSFSVAELILGTSFAQASPLRMEIRLDHGSCVEEFEEVMTFGGGDGSECRYIMWRDASGVFVQPLIGRTESYESVAEAFEALVAKQPIVLSDIDANYWPT
jgi:hypothetical protein